MSETTKPDDIAVVHKEDGTYRVRPEPAGDGRFRYLLDVLRFDEADEVGAQDFSREDDPEEWSVIGTSGENTWPSAVDAVRAGREWVEAEGRRNGLVTLEWVQTALFGRLVAEARRAGLEPDGWSFGQHAGLSWTLMDSIPGPGLRTLGMWQRWQDARVGIDGMISMLEEVRIYRERAREGATE